MDMRVVALVVKGGVPPELLQGYLHRLGHFHGITGEEIFPRLGVVVAQPLCILPPQGDDGLPHVARMVRHLFHGLGENNRLVIAGKERMVTDPLRPGPAGDVSCIVFLLLKIGRERFFRPLPCGHVPDIVFQVR